METKTLFTTIRRLFNKWENAGYPPEEIEEAEKKFGALPGLLKAYYLELGADEQINLTQNRIESPDRLTIEDGHLVFYGENQNCYYWGIPVDQLTQYDPPVCILFPEYSGIKSDRTIQKEHLSDFLDAAAYFNAASWGLEYASELLWVSPQSIDYIRTNYKSKQNDLPGPNAEFYSNHADCIICILDNEFLIYASSSEEHFCEIHNDLAPIAEEL